MSLESIETTSRKKVRDTILDLFPDVDAILTAIAVIMNESGDTEYATREIEKLGNEAFDKWNNGTNYEESLADANRRVLDNIRKELFELIGVGVAEVADYISTRYYATRIHDLGRIMVTEDTRIHAQQELTKGRAYIYHCVHDSRTCEYCRNLDGRIFLSADGQFGDNVPPMHPWCRCWIEWTS